MTKPKYIAPEGGWGWVIVVAFALNNIVTIPLLQGFGMIYGSAFARLNISATQSTIIMNINQAFGLIVGLMNGPLIRRFGYRKMAIIGSIMYSFGIVTTSFATSFIHFVITYGMISSVGMVMSLASFMVSLNTYFKVKKARASGWAMTMTGIGPIVLPHVISKCLTLYDSEGTMLILGALSLNGLIGALLLQPIKRHAKEQKVEPEKSKDDLETKVADNVALEENESLMSKSEEKSLDDVEILDQRNARRKSVATTISSTDFKDDNMSIFGIENPILMQSDSIADILNYDSQQDEEKQDCSTDDEDYKMFKRRVSLGNLEYKRTNSYEIRARKFSLSSMKFGEFSISNNVIAECPEEDSEGAKTDHSDEAENGTCNLPIEVEETKDRQRIAYRKPARKNSDKPIKSLVTRALTRIVLFFDLDLLRDPIYVNIMLGISIAVFAEFNFSVLTPFILKDMHLDTSGVAAVISAIATSDVLLRALAPYIGEWLKKSPRIMYLFSLALLIATRTALIFADSFVSIIIVGLGLGIAKGVRTVYWTLVIPTYVPLEKLASATSIQSLANGILLMTIGPVIGIIKDVTGSYTSCIVFINSVTVITIVMWTTEFAIARFRRRRKLDSSENLELGGKDDELKS